MNTRILLTISLGLLAAAGPAFSQGVKKQPLSRYAKLWTQSRFTEKPPPEEKAPDTTFDDWTLAGVANTPQGARVTLMNKQDRTKRVVIPPGGVRDGFEVISVNVERRAYDTTVVIRKNGKVGTITVDEKAVALKSSAPKAGKGKTNAKNGAKPSNRGNAQQQASPNPGQNRNTKAKASDTSKKRRPRIVRPRK